MNYEEQIKHELDFWEFEMMKRPSMFGSLATKVQTKINSYIPEKVHKAITTAIKQMVKAVLYGSKHTTSNLPDAQLSLMHREALVKSKIDSYSKTGAAEGGITGAGGFLMSLADFPVLIAIKMKLLFEIANLYGFEVRDYRERLYILHIFQLAFSSKTGSQKVFEQMKNWDQKLIVLPGTPKSLIGKRFNKNIVII